MYCSQALRRPAHRACETMHLLTHETPDFITPALWPANSPDLNPVDYQIWWKLQEHVYRSQIREVDQLKSQVAPDRRLGTFPPGSHRWSGQAMAFTSLSLRSTSSTRWTFWTQPLDVLVLPFARMHTWQSITPVLIVDTMLLSDLTKLAVAVAYVDRFC